jgi:hypothetical protein
LTSPRREVNKPFGRRGIVQLIAQTPRMLL